MADAASQESCHTRVPEAGCVYAVCDGGPAACCIEAATFTPSFGEAIGGGTFGPWSTFANFGEPMGGGIGVGMLPTSGGARGAGGNGLEGGAAAAAGRPTPSRPVSLRIRAWTGGKDTVWDGGAIICRADGSFSTKTMRPSAV